MSNQVHPCATQRPMTKQAEGVGFEPTEHFCSRVFETRAFGRAMLPLQTTGHYSTASCVGQNIRHRWHLLSPSVQRSTDTHQIHVQPRHHRQQ